VRSGYLVKRAAVWLLASFAFVFGGCDEDYGYHVVYLMRSGADLNVDAYADLVVGAPLHDGGGAPGSRRGAVFVYFGGPGGLSALPGLTLYGAEDGAEFGSALAYAGDVNRHGAPDLLVGAPFDDGDGNATDEGDDRGRAFVFFGGIPPDGVPDVTMTGAEPGAHFGASLAWLGDVNRDGYHDWIVGAPGDDGDGNATEDGADRGRAFFFLGSRVPDGIPDLVFTGSEVGSAFGFAVASAGDINAGRAPDIAVGAPLDDGDGNATDEGTDRGRVYVFYGGSVLDVVPDLTLTGDEDAAQLGAALAPGCDVNADRIDDLVVGAPLHDAGGGLDADRGEAYVFLGASAPDAVPDLVLSGGNDGGAFGAALDCVGDVDGDGESDFLVGAPLEDPGGLADAGRAYLFRGGASLDLLPDLVLDGAEQGGRFGAAVAGPGDVDGQGGDFFVGAPFDDADGNASDDAVDRGRSFGFRGGPAVLDALPDFVVEGDQDGALAGSALAR
jgi:FG-GAP repeat